MVDTAAILEAMKFWVGYEGPLTTWVLFAAGIALYGLLVWKAYSIIAARYPLGTPRQFAGLGRALWRTTRMVVLMPLVALIYFLVLSAALFVLAKNQTVPQILLIAASLIGAIRVASWLSEDVSKDLAKIVPLGLLGVLIVDPGFLSLETTVARFREVLAQVGLILRLFGMLVLIEVAAQPILWINHLRQRRFMPVT